jgi:hypothetical protein
VATVAATQMMTTGSCNTNTNALATTGQRKKPRTAQKMGSYRLAAFNSDFDIEMDSN